MLRNYLKTAWRNLQRSRMYSFINIAGLATGLACAILITLWIKDELSYDQFHTNGSQLYRVMAITNWGELNATATVPSNLNLALKKDIPQIKYVATVSDDHILLTVGNNSFKEKGYYATSDMLRMFSFDLLHGNINTALDAPDKIVITQKLAEKYFGNENPIGKIIKINTAEPFVVTGVVKNIPANSSLQFDWLIPFEYFRKKNEWLDKWGSYSTYMYAMLTPGTSLEKINSRLKHFLTEEKKEETEDEIFLQPFTEVYLHGNFKNAKPDGGRIEYVRLFSIIAIFVLVIACINFMNLTTARSIKRAKEVGIRKVIGAERKAIIAQFLGEALLLTLLSVLLALIIAELSLPAFNELTGKTIRISFLDPSFLVTMAIITLITGLISGSYPAFYLSGFRPVHVLKSAINKSGSKHILRKVLVVFQFSLSTILIISTIIVNKQVEYIKNKNIGFNKENLLSMAIEGDTYNHLDAVMQDLSTMPGIISTTAISDYPIDIQGTSADLSWPEKAPNQVVTISATWVGYDYLKTLGVPLTAGRDFARDRSDSNSYIVNESAVRMMNLKNPVGQQIKFWVGAGPIIGVMKDFHIQSLHKAITPLILCLQPKNAAGILVRTQPGKTQQAIASLKSVYEKYNKSYPFEYHFIDELYEKNYKSEIMVSGLTNAFAVMAIFISSLGLFGLATFTAEQRTKEVGIRKVLGASVGDIARLLSKDFMRFVLLAILIAIPLSWWAMSYWLQDFAYRVAMSWWIFLMAGLAAVIIALLTVSFQAIKAAIANPVKSLKTE
ncbi:MAG: ABC transporter permease [Bacteroidetes bacterium]|nr:ABC transporter permease [Bacteroidota bacterium]